MTIDTGRTINHNATLDADLTVIVANDHPMDLSQAVTMLRFTLEGIIMDFYQDGELTGTIAKTYEEWFDLAK